MPRPARASWARLCRVARLAAPVLATGGCLSGSSTLPTTTTVTMITADPTAFAGSATCGTRLRKYVATLIDVTDGSLAAYSSGPTSCTELVSFAGNVVILGDSYIAAIDGYDRDDIQPDSRDLTNRTMVTTGDPLEIVAPRWTTTCGRAPASPEAGPDGSPQGGVPTNPLFSPVQAKASTEVFLLGCIPFTDPVSEPDGGAGATDDASHDGG